MGFTYLARKRASRTGRKCARRSWRVSVGSNPTRVKLSQQPPLCYLSRISGGNKTDEAGVQEIPGRNASECCKLRNSRGRGGRQRFWAGRQHAIVRHRGGRLRSSGVVDSGTVSNGACRNLGEPLCSLKGTFRECAHKQPESIKVACPA
jgi:hypothetical protein